MRSEELEGRPAMGPSAEDGRKRGVGYGKASSPCSDATVSPSPGHTRVESFDARGAWEELKKLDAALVKLEAKNTQLNQSGRKFADKALEFKLLLDRNNAELTNVKRELQRAKDEARATKRELQRAKAEAQHWGTLYNLQAAKNELRVANDKLVDIEYELRNTYSP